MNMSVRSFMPGFKFLIGVYSPMMILVGLDKLELETIDT